MNANFTPEEYADVIRDAASINNSRSPFVASKAQMATVGILFKEFAELAEIEVLFAIVGSAGDWFRRECLKILFDVDSMTKLSNGQLSTLIDEFGRKAGGMWQLSEEGKVGLYHLLDLVEEKFPTQARLL